MVSHSEYEQHKFWTVREQVSLFHDTIGYHAANALAHVVLGDDNYEDEFINAALERVEAHGYPLPDGVSYEQYRAVVGFLKFLLALPSEWRERPEYD